MKLLLNSASPFSRLVLAAAVFKGISNKLMLEWINPWSSPDALLEVSPLGQIPVFITDGSLILTESLCICQHVDRIGQGDLLYCDGNERTELLYRLGFVKGMMDKAYQLAIKHRFHGDHASPLSDRALAALDRMQQPVLEYLHNRLPERPIDLADIALVVTFEYMELRLPHLAVIKPVVDTPAFKTMQEQPALAATKIPILQAMEQNAIDCLTQTAP